jgi:3',5'-cyclic-AMP phosphodiesterase
VPRFAHITDSHIYADPESRFDGMDTRKSLAAVLRDLADSVGSVDAILATGDLTMDGSAEAYRHLASVLPSSPPTICIPGNHDEPNVWQHAAPALYRQWPCVVDFPDWRLLCLDTRIAGRPEGALGLGQHDWLVEALADSETRHIALIMHHPPLALGSPWMDAMGLTDAEALWTAIARHRSVRLIICGHVHQNFDHFHTGVRVLTSPSTCIQFAPRATRYARDPRQPAYRLLELHDDGRVDTSVHRVHL